MEKGKFSKGRIYLMGAMTGVLLALSFPPLPVGLAAFIAFYPLLMALEEKEYKHPYFLIYIAFFIYHAGANWWIGSWQSETDPYLTASGIALAFIHPFFFYVPFAIYINFRKKFGLNAALWLLPFIWTAFEWVHSLGDAAYPWLSIGYTQITSHAWVQIADIFGATGIGFFIMLFNVLFFKSMIVKQEHGLISNKELLKHRQARLYIVAMLLIYFVPITYSFVVSPKYKHEDLLKAETKFNIGIIQPNINPWEKWAGGVLNQIQLHQDLQDNLIKGTHGLDMCVWSETAVPFRNFEFNSDHDFPMLQQWVDSTQCSLLTGFAEIEFYDAQSAPPLAKEFLLDANKKFQSYNATILLNPEQFSFGQKNKVYRKMKLTPFAERLPYEEYLSFAKKWFEWGVGISSWGKGEEQFPLTLKTKHGTVKIGAINCIESIFPDFVRNFSAKGAEILTVTTNDAWYNYTSGPRQHYYMSCMRAIENRRYLVRCANSGVSAFISPLGKSLMEIPQYTRKGFAMTVPSMSEQTIYTRFGDWLPQLCGLITILGFVYTFIRKKTE